MMAGSKVSLEEAFEQLESIIEKLEDPEISLEDSFKQYESGMELLKKCNQQIDKVEKKIQVLNENGEIDEF